MASNVKVSTAAANAMAGDGTNKGLLALLAAGYVTFYTGTQPANPGVSDSGFTKYGILTLNSPGATQSNGVLTLSIASAGLVLAGTGVDQPTWARISTSAGPTAGGLIDCSCGTSGADITVAANWVAGGTITYSGGITVSVPNP